MVRGWRAFSEHFAAYRAQYVVIGGTATELAMTEAGLRFRGTKDLDIVLVIETLTPEFLAHFWAFIATGGYEWQASDGPRPKRFRFVRATRADYPYMIELFSRQPEGLQLPEGRSSRRSRTTDRACPRFCWMTTPIGSCLTGGGTRRTESRLWGTTA